MSLYIPRVNQSKNINILNQTPPSHTLSLALSRSAPLHHITFVTHKLSLSRRMAQNSRQARLYAFVVQRDVSLQIVRKRSTTLCPQA